MDLFSRLILIIKNHLANTLFNLECKDLSHCTCMDFIIDH